MSDFVKKGNKYYRNNSDGTLTEVKLSKEGYFYWADPSGKLVRTKETYNNTRTPKQEKKESLVDKLKTAITYFGNYSSMTEPGGAAIQAAEGNTYNSNGTFNVNKETEGTKQLRPILGTISLAGLTGYGGGAALSYTPAIVPEITQLPWWQTAVGTAAGSMATGLAADEISKAITDKTIGGNIREGISLLGEAGQMYADIIPEAVWDFFNPFYLANTEPVANGVSKFIANPGKTFWENYPYKLDDAIQTILYRGKKDIPIFLKTPITENPVKAVRQARLQRLGKSVEIPETDWVPQEGDIASIDLADLLTRERFILGNPYYGSKYAISTRELLYDEVPQLDYVSLKDISDVTGLDTKNPLNWFLLGKTWWSINSQPAIATNGWIFLNKPALKSYKLNYNATKAHEGSHVLLRVAEIFNPDRVKLTEGVFDFSHLPEDIRNYFLNNNFAELTARGSQLKSYFNNKPLDGEKLKYAAKHYVPDTGMDNNMTQFFSGIKDWDAAANWINTYALKKGGRLIQKKNNRNFL